MRSALLLSALLALSAPALGAAPKKAPGGKAQVTETAVPLDTDDDARKFAEDYLKAISHQGNEGAIDTLLGGATMTARIFTLENFKIVGREKHRHEEGELADLHAHTESIDKAGRDALTHIMGGGPGADPDGLAVQELTSDQASKILAPTKVRASAFNKSHPVFAYLARVDRQVYWHPKNPFRKLLAEAGKSGKYSADIDYFWVETVEGAHEDKNVRKWPLRVVRFKAGGYDTGLKILPASDWNAE
jgi:hypothetical protein